MYDILSILNIEGQAMKECAQTVDCEVCSIAPTSVLLEKCNLVDEEDIYVSDCPCQKKVLELTIKFSDLCPKGDFTRLAVCVKISEPYDPVQPPTIFVPFAMESKFVDLPATGEPCNTQLDIPFTFCLDECICSEKKVDVKVCAHYIF